MQYLLDTSICVFFLRGKMNLDEIIKEKEKQILFKDCSFSYALHEKGFKVT